MKWKAKPSPKKGDTRIVKSFALLPTRILEGYWVWLEFYLKEQVYSCGSGPGGYSSGWITNSKTQLLIDYYNKTMEKTELLKELQRVSKELFDKKEFYSSGKINQAIDVITASTIDEGKKSKENYRKERKGVLSSFSHRYRRKMIN